MGVDGVLSEDYIVKINLKLEFNQSVICTIFEKEYINFLSNNYSITKIADRKSKIIISVLQSKHIRMGKLNYICGQSCYY